MRPGIPRAVTNSPRPQSCSSGRVVPSGGQGEGPRTSTCRGPTRGPALWLLSGLRGEVRGAWHLASTCHCAAAITEALLLSGKTEAQRTCVRVWMGPFPRSQGVRAQPAANPIKRVHSPAGFWPQLLTAPSGGGAGCGRGGHGRERGAGRDALRLGGAAAGLHIKAGRGAKARGTLPERLRLCQPQPKLSRSPSKTPSHSALPSAQ